MAFSSGLWGPCVHMSRAFSQRCFSTTGSLGAIQKMTRVRVVDNSALGNTPYHRPPRCIHVYNKNGVGKKLPLTSQRASSLWVHRPHPRVCCSLRLHPRVDSLCCPTARQTLNIGACGWETGFQSGLCGDHFGELAPPLVGVPPGSPGMALAPATWKGVPLAADGDLAKECAESACGREHSWKNNPKPTTSSRDGEATSLPGWQAVPRPALL
uniref:Large ribosomal subunit protein uL14m n=1 Tax=Bos taurus TaxID=9913 RepID=A0A3Q1N0U9_BOVIN